MPHRQQAEGRCVVSFCADGRFQRISDISSSVGDSKSDLVGCVDGAIDGIEDGMAGGILDGEKEGISFKLKIAYRMGTEMAI